ncbi:hypothetical protein LTS18_007905, partial [Coniosporium uncinatum]
MAKPSILNDVKSSDVDLDVDGEAIFEGDEEQAVDDSLVEHLGSELPDPDGNASNPTSDLPSNQLLREQTTIAEERTSSIARTRDTEGVEGAALLSVAKSKGKLKRPSAVGSLSAPRERAPSSAALHSSPLAGGSGKRRRDPYEVTSPAKQTPPSPSRQSTKATEPVEAGDDAPQQAQAELNGTEGITEKPKRRRGRPPKVSVQEGPQRAQEPAPGSPKGKTKIAEPPQVRRSNRNKRSSDAEGDADAVAASSCKRPKTAHAAPIYQPAKSSPRAPIRMSKANSSEGADLRSTRARTAEGVMTDANGEAEAEDEQEAPQPMTAKKPAQVMGRTSKPTPTQKSPQKNRSATTDQEKDAAAEYYEDNQGEEEEEVANAQGDGEVIVGPDIFEHDISDADVDRVLCGHFKTLKDLFHALDHGEVGKDGEKYNRRAKSRVKIVSELQDLCSAAIQHYAQVVTSVEDAGEEERHSCIEKIHELVSNLVPEDFTIGERSHIEDLYELVFPGLLRVLRASLAWYAVMAPNAITSALVAQLQTEVSLMGLIVQLRMTANKWPKPDTKLSIVRPLFNTVIAPLKNEVLPAFAKNLSRRQAEQAAAERIYQSRLHAHQRY